MARWIVCAAIAACLMSCSKKQYDEYVLDKRHSEPVSIQYDSGVPGWQKDLLEDDFDTVSRLNVTSTEHLQTFGLSQITGQTLNQWLGERMKVIVAEDFNLKTQLEKKGSLTSRPQTFELDMWRSASLAAVTNAENTGGAAYLTCVKDNNALCDLKLRDGTRIEVKTPRINVVRIGEGLFRDRVANSPKDSRAQSFVRICTIFHEGGHTNGHGEDVCFPHAECPTTVTDPNDPLYRYRGSSACDLRTNGPYPVGVACLKILMSACGTKCNASEKEEMRLIIADYEARLLPGHQYVDPKPERIP